MNETHEGSTIEDIRSAHKLEDARGDGQKRFALPSTMSGTQAQKARDVPDTIDVPNSLRKREGHHMSEALDFGVSLILAFSYEGCFAKINNA